MHLQFEKMVQFTRLVKAEGRLREFNFRKVKSPNEELFTVNVCTERGDRIHFSMHKEEDAWKIIPGQLPQCRARVWALCWLPAERPRR